MAVTALGGVSARADAATASAAASTVKVIEYPGSDVSWLAYIAQQKGFFKENHVSVSFVQLPAGQQATAALVGGGADIAPLDTNNLAPLLAQGQKFSLLVNAVTNFWVLVGSKSMKGDTLKQAMGALKGKSVNAPSVAGTGALQVLQMSKAYGQPKGSVSVVADPTNASLTAGQVQASMTDVVGACRLEALGYPELMNFVNPPETASSYPAGVRSLIGLAGLGYWAPSSWVSSNKSVAKGFQKAIEQAIAWAKAPSNQTALVTMLRKSSFNISALNNQQWSSCVARVASTFNPAYTAQDTLTWGKLVKQEGLASSLPPASHWQFAGLPKS
jgi:ABC-type nitrate/sulfonate/bicarbonate transport system substrate-binding protein